MKLVMQVIGILFFVLSLVAFIVTVWLMWKDFSFWKLVADVIGTSIGAFWGLVLIFLSKFVGR